VRGAERKGCGDAVEPESIAAKIVAVAPTMLATLPNRICTAAGIDEVWSRDRVRR